MFQTQYLILGAAGFHCQVYSWKRSVSPHQRCDLFSSNTLLMPFGFLFPPQSGLFSTIAVRISDHANTVCPGLVSLTSSVYFNLQRGRDWCLTEPRADNKCSALLQWCSLTLWFIVAIIFSFTVWVMKLINLILFKENWVRNGISATASQMTHLFTPSFLKTESLPLWAFVTLPLSW